VSEQACTCCNCAVLLRSPAVRNTAQREAPAHPQLLTPPAICLFSQEAKLRAAWDDQGGAPGATAAIAAELGWRKGAVGRHLKALGLKRGVLTAVQVSGYFSLSSPSV
jgi:hypothetical protein